MAKIGFVGFGEVNTPVDVIVRKCSAAEKALREEGLDLYPVYPVSDDYEETQVNDAVTKLAKESFDALVVCVAGWIPTHAVVKVTEHYRHLPMVLWGLCGWMEGDRIVTTADQAGTTGLRATFEGLGYTFRYVYDVMGKKTKSAEVAEFCRAAVVAKDLKVEKVGMAGYRDMNLYGTLFDGLSLKKKTGIEIETFEMLEIEQRYAKLTDAEKRKVVEDRILRWHFLKPVNDDAMMKCAHDAILYHHERYDGNGYPYHLAEEEIPLAAQMVGLADCYDALISARPYKPSYLPERAYNMIMNGECGAFSDEILSCLPVLMPKR